MLKSVKSKIVFLSVVQFVALCAVGAVLLRMSYNANKRQRIEKCDLAVSFLCERVNKTAARLQEFTKGLARVGEVFFEAASSGRGGTDMMELSLVKCFESNPVAVGGGVWFEPFSIKPDSRLFCRYALKKDGKIIIDRDFETEKYNYPDKGWYKTVKMSGLDGRKAVWTAPYFDTSGSNALMTTVGVGMLDGGGKFVGMSTTDWSLDSIIDKVRSVLPTEDSTLLFADRGNDFILVLHDGGIQRKFIGRSLSSVKWYRDDVKNGEILSYGDRDYFTFSKTLDNKMLIVMNVPADELLGDVIRRIWGMFLALIIICFGITYAVYRVLSANLNKPISLLLKKTAQFGAGDLDAKIEISSPEEFSVLAKSFNKMTGDIKRHVEKMTEINAEKRRIEAELEIAKSIQHSNLPNVFPPYPEREDFDIYASMSAAKEVGGDFYDFFMVDDSRFAFLIADVSGKGIPAALFMMTTSTLIRNLGQTGLLPEALMTRVNKQICKSNDQDFFVSVFLCSLDSPSGRLTCVNAGHNPPLVRRAGGEWEYLKCAPNLVVGALESTQYSSFWLDLRPGDSVFLYTDGVTEAQNSRGELFGEERLRDCLNRLSANGDDVRQLLLDMEREIAEYAGGEPQYDDVTMLAFTYRGN